MTLLQSSALYRLWLFLRYAYGDSSLRRALAALGRTCAGWFRDSRLVRFLCRERKTLWPQSLTCRVLTACTACPGDLLHRWYLAWQATFDDSFFANLAFQLGHGTAIAESWYILCLWTIPFLYWDNAYSLIAFAFLLVLFHAGAMRHRSFRLDMADIGGFPLVFFLAVLLAVPLSYRPDLSARFLWYHLPAALCVLVTVSAVRCGEDLKRLCAGATGVTAAASIYGVFQRIRGVRVNLSYVDLTLNPDMPGRVMSYFDNPNTFGEVLVILLPLVLSLAICAKSRMGKVLAGGVWAVGTAALVMTYSRAGWVGFALSVGLMVLVLRPGLIPALLLLCAAAIPLLPSAVWIRILTIFNFSDTTTSSRFPLYDAALSLLRQSPVYGGGLGVDAVKAYIRAYRLYKGTAPFVHAHNFYLEVWMETGLLGITSFLASMAWSVKRGFWAVQKAAPSPARTITCGASAGLCGIALCGMADYPWHYPRVMVIFWFLFAMALAGVKVCRREAEQP